MLEFAPADFIPISVATLMPTETVGLDLFQDAGDGHSVILYRGHDYPLEVEDIRRLRHRGIHRLFIKKEARGTYQKYLRTVATDTADVPPAVRTGAINEVVRDVLGATFLSGDVPRTVEAANKLGSLAAEVICSDDFAISDLFEVLHHDYATFTHSTNVSFYCGILASALGYDDADVRAIAIGGLLHDLGKLDIDEDILCKPGRLDDREFRVIKSHPLTGFRKLVTRDDLNEGQMLMAYSHHERLDGRGYPVGLVGKEIHPWARICMIVDVFEALTSERPYRSPMSRRKAIELQQRDAGSAFDTDMLRCWTEIIKNDLAN